MSWYIFPYIYILCIWEVVVAGLDITLEKVPDWNEQQQQPLYYTNGLFTGRINSNWGFLNGESNPLTSRTTQPLLHCRNYDTLPMTGPTIVYQGAPGVGFRGLRGEDPPCPPGHARAICISSKSTYSAVDLVKKCSIPFFDKLFLL